MHLCRMRVLPIRLSSLNGAWVDGRQVSTAWLEDGCEIALGAWRG